jgi:TRAP-type C4-dicarboxylate transport system permease small subunit
VQHADRVVLALSRAGEGLAAVAIAAMALILGLEALLRKAGHPQTWAEDTVALLVIWSAFLAVGAVERDGEQMQMDWIPAKLGPRARAALDLVHTTIGLAFVTFLAVYTWQVVAASIRFGKMNPGSLDYPVALSQSAVLAGALLLGPELVRRAVRLAGQAWRRA